jgi:hypothetical protein
VNVRAALPLLALAALSAPLSACSPLSRPESIEIQKEPPPAPKPPPGAAAPQPANAPAAPPGGAQPSGG